MRDINFSKNSLWTLLSDMVIFVSGLVYLVILARVLGPEGKGIHSLILLIPGVIMVFGSFGMESANVYFVGTKKYPLRDVVSNSIILSVLLGVLLVLLFWGASQTDWFYKFIQDNKIPISYLWAVVFTIPLYFISAFLRNALRGYGHLGDYNTIRIIEGLSLFLFGVIFLIILKRGLWGAIASSVLSIIFAAISSIFLTKKLVRIFPLNLNTALLKGSSSYGSKVYLANGLSFLNYRLDMFLITIFLTPVAVGFYSVAVNMAEKLLIIPGAFATVLLPKISSSGQNEANHLTSRVLRHTTLIMLVICLAMLFLITFMVRLFFGASFLPSVLPFIILLPGILAFSIGGVLAADLSGRGKPQYAIWSSMTALIANIVLNIILIPKMGIVGAALASSISYWLDTLVVLGAFMCISKNRLKEVFIIKKEDFQDYYNLYIDFFNSSSRIR
ncbi:MAG: hypothetical protein A3H01_01565 [Candidatus Wildermuthbacteria bacterium RIFCSPLOWO2_12_FULL_40_9]|uniref:Uncharacterized protein n=2 Tax=Candidatus Wildermuthiibacteriota TaxID=1817923 RepID=A0A1G2REP2_9BACT|nr:MAG: hypothetical protein A3F15_01605 [Candidatus Wildermuthbacteria bacterium RIFCSPHIGHO2_12_FULL_40_12]OHA76406.1 MAG: hypothetical protein A3H01_01565 [Candidatus Wildermuthbacteria bacterium RIFCSPLOWO2_12_FULL_40_9]